MTTNINSGADITGARYSLLINSDDLISIFNPQGILTFVNKAYCGFFDIPEFELIGSEFTNSFPAGADDFSHLLKDITPTDHTVTTMRRSGRAGHEKWISWKLTGIFSDNGQLLEILSVGRNVNDIVEIKKEKNKLLNTLTAFRKAIDTNIICTITDARGIITYANDNFCKISKYSMSELIGKTHNIVNSGHHPRSFFTDMWQTITQGHMWTAEIKNKAKDGTYYWVKSVIIPIKEENDGGHISGYLSIRILIDDQKRIEEERETYTRSIQDMLHMVSHEIRKPIASCQGLLYLMQDNVPTTVEEYSEILSYMLSSATELDNYSRKLTDYLQKNVKNVS